VIDLDQGYYENELPPIRKWWATDRGVDLTMIPIRPDLFPGAFFRITVVPEDYVRWASVFENTLTDIWAIHTYVDRNTLRRIHENGNHLESAIQNFLLSNDPRQRCPIQRRTIRHWCRKYRGS
jgi:hypothetical protein